MPGHQHQKLLSVLLSLKALWMGLRADIIGTISFVNQTLRQGRQTVHLMYQHGANTGSCCESILP